MKLNKLDYYNFREELIYFTRGDGKKIKLILENWGEPQNLRGMCGRFAIKSLDKIDMPDNSEDTLAYGNINIIDDVKGIVEITITPEQSLKFPLPKLKGDFLILAIGVYNKAAKLSIEYLYKLYVRKNVLNSLY